MNSDIGHLLALVGSARNLLTPRAFRGPNWTVDEWTEARIAWHRLDGRDDIADELQREHDELLEARKYYETRRDR